MAMQDLGKMKIGVMLASLAFWETAEAAEIEEE
jgi:hypothetical protein